MTRLYVSSTSAGFVPTTVRGGWEQTSGHAVKGMHSAQDLAGTTTIQSISLSESSASSDFDVLLLRAVSTPLAADHTFSGTLNAMFAVAELNDADFAYYLHVYLTQGDSDTPRGTLLANYADLLTNEWGQTTASGKALSSAQTLSSIAGLAGDRIVAEIGFRSRNTISSSRAAIIYFGGNGSDLVSGGSGTSGIGYLDFSDSFTLTDNPTLRFTQLAVETVRRPNNPNVRITQLAPEIIRKPTTANLRMSQFAIEVARKNGTPMAAAQQPIVIIVAG